MGRWVDEGLGLVREMTLYKRRSAICNVATERGVREQLDIERRDSEYQLFIQIRHMASMRWDASAKT